MTSHTLSRPLARIVATLLVVSLLGLPLLACSNRAQTGAGGGALAGGLLGALVARDKVVGAAVGAGIGLVLGYIVGNEWDKYDQRQMNQTLETTPTGQTSSWVNPDTGAQYAATPTQTYREDGRIYRDVKLRAEVDGKEEIVNAKAYRKPDGTWQLVN